MSKKIVFLIIILTLTFCQRSFAFNASSLNIDFFSRFNDVYLCNYVIEAIENNHNAKQATLRVEEYRQNVKAQFASELPNFSVSASYLGVSIPKFNPNLEVQKNAFVLPFLANYEADLLLKNHDKTKSVKKTYEMSKYDEISAYLVLVSDVATVYTNILQYDKLVNEQKKIVDNYNSILSRDNKKFSRGIISSIELNNSKINSKNAQIELENLLKQRDILLIDFAILLGKSPDCATNIERGVIENFEYSNLIPIPEEIDSDVIFSRPDVKRVETALEKAHIDIRVARKEFLPTFNIAGIWAFNTIAPGRFFSWESSLAAIFAGATQSIFTGSRKVANLRFQKVKYEELFEQYKQTDIEAIKEVNTSLCIIKHDKFIEKETNENLKFEENKLNDTRKKLNQGTVSQSQYLNSENLYIQQEMNLTKVKTQRLVNYYTLYKAVGGKL